MKSRRYFFLSLCLVLVAAANSPLLAANLSTGRYALILADPPAVRHFPTMAALRENAAGDYRQQIRATQQSLRQELERRNLRVTGSMQILLNAVFVQAPADRVAELRSLPGVQSVVPVHVLRPHLDKAVQLANVPAAWTALGGTSNAGSGVKIAIVDSGIDQTHPGFQDPSLPVPAGFPKCQGQDCAFTNNKVIVARSYVSMLAAGSPGNPAADSRPDDVSPRDRIGHGTALAMVAAGVTNTGPSDTITGVAPKAWLGNYKIFGSPGLNDFSGGDIFGQALEDALLDGMDIAVLSLGSPALSGPLDQGAACGATGSDACDLEATVVEQAVQAGLTVVVSAGNSGDSGNLTPTPNTVESPASAPSAISVGASTNSHVWISSVHVTGQNAPPNLQTIGAIFGDGPIPDTPLTAPLKDVAALDGTGQACRALPAGSLTGAIALIVRTPTACTFATKAAYAANAGATGVIFMQATGQGPIFGPGGVSATGMPSVMISDSDGAALKSYLAANPNLQVTLDPAAFAVSPSVLGYTANEIASFSSRGPSINYLFKPELVAVGTDMYMATEKFDPNGEMYDPSGYTVADGTSFSGPTVAGAAALLKQKYPGFGPAQLKSALVNSATQDVTDNGSVAGSSAVGGGKLNAGGAVQTVITTDPATVSFGALGRSTSLPAVQRIAIHYSGSIQASFTLAVAPGGSARNVPVLDKTSLTFSPSQPDQVVTLTLSGSTPPAGYYDGAVTIQGGGTMVRVPYMYVVGDGATAYVVPLIGSGFDGIAGQTIPDGAIGFKIVDHYGVAVPNLVTQWAVTRGGGRIASADSRTDGYGIAMAIPVLGLFTGRQEFTAQAGGFVIPFDGTARIAPTITAGGVVNAASFQAGSGIVPGSYISIFGVGLSDYLAASDGVNLPPALYNVGVSFDVPSAGLSLPGRMMFVSSRQVNVQVPWELRGQSSVQMKVTVNYNPGPVITVPVADYAPAVYVNSQGYAAALDENYSLVSASNPARRGHTIQVFLNGLGPVDHQPASGEPAPAGTLVRTLSTPTVMIGGVPATVQFSGLAPGFPGLNQIDVVVPPNAPTGVQQLVVANGGVTAPAVKVPVE